MSTSTSYPHLSTDKNGTVRIGRTRYKVKHLAAEHYQHGWTAEELMRQHPDLRPEEVYMALAYFYDHYEEILDELQTSFDRVQQAKTAPPISRDELIKRVSKRNS